MHRLQRCSTGHEALLYTKLRGDKVKCGLCERRCVIPQGDKGICKTRMNIEGTLYSLVYGNLSAMESRPIEIKPFFHYWPGSTALTFSTWSCNFDCIWCQNHHLSKTEPNPANAASYDQEKIVQMAKRYGDEGLCASFQEPTLLTEWALPLFKLGHEHELYCCFVSNGYMTIEALKLLKESGMSGLKIDVKGDKETYKKYCGGADIDKIWKKARTAKKMGFHVEMVNLIVTDVNDDEECLRWTIKKHLKAVGSETPLHFTRYFPAYKFHNQPTRIETLERAYNLAKDEGVLFPYIGNVHNHKYENTYCPNCGETLIQRRGYTLVTYKVTEDKKCPRCHRSMPITGRRIKKWQFLL